MQNMITLLGRIPKKSDLLVINIEKRYVSANARTA